MIRINDYSHDHRMAKYLKDTVLLGESLPSEETLATDKVSYNNMRSNKMGFDLKTLVGLCNQVTDDSDLSQSSVAKNVANWPDIYKKFVMTLWQTEGGNHMCALFPTEVYAKDCGLKGVSNTDLVYQPDWSTMFMLTSESAVVTSPFFTPKGKNVCFYFGDKEVKGKIYVIATREFGLTGYVNPSLNYLKVDNDPIIKPTKKGEPIFQFWQNMHMGLKDRGSAKTMNYFLSGKTNRIFLTIASEHSATQSYCVRDIVYNGLKDLLVFTKPKKFRVRGINQERFYPCEIAPSMAQYRIDYCQVEAFFRTLSNKSMNLYNDITAAFKGYDNAMNALQDHEYKDIKIQCTLDAYWNVPYYGRLNFNGGVWSKEFKGSSIYLKHKRWIPYMEAYNG